MTVLHESIEVARTPEEAFAYIADFTTTAEWDSTARSATKLTQGAVDLGTRFQVVCAIAGGSIDLEYVVTRLEQDRRIDLSGSCRWFDIEDSIRFEPTEEGTRIDYRAEFKFPAALKLLARGFERGLQRMGRASMRGMREALEKNYPVAGEGRKQARRLLLSELSRFTRLGYSRGQRNRHPMSAYIGDKHVLITGASSGIGYAAALELARRGAGLTLVMRDRARAAKVVQEIVEATGNQDVHCEIADLALLAQVDGLVRRLRQRGRPIDVLVNNAGALFNDYGETEEGLERSLALLLLSPWRLTLGLKPLLLQAPAPRVINVVSGGMYSQKLDVARLHAGHDNFSGAVAYARAKRALSVVTEQWGREWAGEGIVVNAMHPGWADTPGVESSLPRFHTLMRPLLRSPEEGADTIVWLAVAREAGKVSGKLFLDREIKATHLLPRTQDSPDQRRALRDFLADYAPPPRHTQPTRRKRAA